MKILLLGKNGQVGWELQRALAPLGEVIALGRENGGDLADSDSLKANVRSIAPQVIVNAAAYTAVDKAENEAELAMQINCHAPAMLAREAQALGAMLLHYSTDYVFDGSGDQSRAEGAATAPLSVYGKTKLAGEDAIHSSGCLHLILRTSWVYAARGGNFAKTMLRLATERDQLKVIADQIEAPTGAELLAYLSAHILRATLGDPALGGIYHATATGETSWYDYAAFVIDYARRQGRPIRVEADQLLPIPTSEYPAAAQRPLNSRLSSAKLQQNFDLCLPPWQQGVERMLCEIL